MALLYQPLTTVLCSIQGYAALFTIANNFLPSSPQENLKVISTIHATLTTSLALYALRQPWPVDHPLPPLHIGLGTSDVDDSTNPTITGRNWLGNAVTAWETGYLVFDSAGMLWASPRSGRGTLSGLVKRDPVMVFHHLTLLSGLGILQFFVSRGRERGVFVITAFLLMNASTPLLHVRWFLRQSGKSSVVVDAVFAMVFAVCRIGVVFWVLRRYGRWHGLGAWEALSGQRWICQVGTAGLVGVNGVWVSMLVRSIVRRVVLQGGQGGKTLPPR